MWSNCITQIRGGPNCIHTFEGRKSANFASQLDQITPEGHFRDSTEGTTHIRRVVIRLGIGPHSSFYVKYMHISYVSVPICVNFGLLSTKYEFFKLRWCPLLNHENVPLV